MINLLLVLLVSLLAGAVHPFHISICDIEHDQDTNSLQITTRIFQDDFELALKEMGETDGFFQETSQQHADEVLKEFFGKHLVIAVDSKKMAPNFLGYEIEENVVWSYLEIEQVPELHEVDLTYSALVDTFDDQINLVHIKYKGKIKSLKFQMDQLTGTATFAN